MRSTETAIPTKAREFLQRWRDEERADKYGAALPGAQIRHKCLTIAALINDYVAAGFPTKKMKKKAILTLEKEQRFLKPLLAYWGAKNPEAINLGDCDAYREWRNSGGYVTTRKFRSKDPKMAKLKTYITKGGDRCVDMELDVLSNILHLAKRRCKIRNHGLIGRGKYTSEVDVRHCREVAPTPAELHSIEQWLRSRGEHDVADIVCFLAFSGLRIGEALERRWVDVIWSEEIIDVRRSKNGIFPWVPILPEMKQLLIEMRNRCSESGIQSHLLFPGPFENLKPQEQQKPRDPSAIRHRLTIACKSLGIRHVAPHGLRSYFVTQAREAGLTDAEIAMLIGDKTGPAIIAKTYGDVRSEHLIRQAQRIKLRVASGDASIGSGMPKSMPTSLGLSSDTSN